MRGDAVEKMPALHKTDILSEFSYEHTWTVNPHVPYAYEEPSNVGITAFTPHVINIEQSCSFLHIHRNEQSCQFWSQQLDACWLGVHTHAILGGWGEVLVDGLGDLLRAAPELLGEHP